MAPFCSEFVRKSKQPDKITGKIALTVGYRVNAQRPGLFGAAATIYIGNGLFELREALLPRLFGQRCIHPPGKKPRLSLG